MNDTELEKRKSADHFSPKAGVEVKISQALSTYGSFSESFKVPDANTLIFETPNLFTPNPNIEPQTAKHYEIGARYAHPVFGSLRVDYFYIETKKEIPFDTNGIGIKNKNKNSKSFKSTIVANDPTNKNFAA